MSASFYPNPSMSLQEIEGLLAAYTPDPRCAHDRWIFLAVQEAVAAVREGNAGIGAVLVDPAGEVVERAHNQRLRPYHRSDLHAEMNVVTRFEERCRDVPTLLGHTLYSSLEPCPMCVVRLITAGIGHVYHAAPDPESGGVCMLDRLTPVWIQMARGLEFGEATCSPTLKLLARETWLVTANARRETPVR